MSLPVVAVALGAGIGVGLLLVAAGFYGVDDVPSRPGLSLAAVVARGDRLVLRAGLAAAAGLAGGVLTGVPAIVVLCAAGAGFAPSMVGAKARREASIARTEALASWAEQLRDTLGGSAGLEGAITASAAVAPSAIRREVAALVTAMDYQRLDDALVAFASSVADPSADTVVAGLVLATRDQARDLRAVLSAVAASARRSVSDRLDVEAGRARTYTAARVVLSVTLGYVAVNMAFNPGLLESFSTVTGQLILLVVGACFGTGLWGVARLARGEEPARFLTAVDRGST